MTLKEIILTAIGFITSYFLKGAFKEAFCDVNSFGCFLGFII
jgi:hypothetical protein